MMGHPFQKAPVRAHGLGNAPSAAHYRGWHTANMNPHGAGPMPHTSHPATSGGTALPAGSMGTMQSGALDGTGYALPTNFKQATGDAIGGGAVNPMGGHGGAPGVIGGAAVNPMGGQAQQSGGQMPQMDDGGEVPGQEYAPPTPAAPAGAGGGGQQADMSQSQGHDSGTSALPTPNLPTHAAAPQPQQQEDASGGPAAKRQVLDNALDMVQRVYKYRQGKHGLRGGGGGGGGLTQQPNVGQMDQQFGGGGRVRDPWNQEDFNMSQQYHDAGIFPGPAGSMAPDSGPGSMGPDSGAGTSGSDVGGKS